MDIISSSSFFVRIGFPFSVNPLLFIHTYRVDQNKYFHILKTGKWPSWGFSNIWLWVFFSKTGFCLVEIWRPQAYHARIAQRYLTRNWSSLMAILIPFMVQKWHFFLKAASASWGQCEDELRPAEILTETFWNRFKVKFGASDFSIF